MLTGALLAMPAASEGQQPGRVYQIGVLPSLQTDTASLEALRQGLRDLGWLEGRDLKIVLRSPEGEPGRLPALAGELASMPVDIIVAGSLPASLAAKGVTSRIPIVSVYAFDPVEAGLVASLARPGGNVTGLSAMASEYVGKMLQVLREVAPRAHRIAVLGDPGNPSYATYWRELNSLSPRPSLIAYSVRRAEDIAGAFSAMGSAPTTALFVMHQPFTFVHRRRIVDLARSKRLVAVYGTREYIEAGGLLSYGVSPVDLYRRAAGYVDKILKGAKPADLPVEQPTKFELVINLKTAKALGLTIPPSLVGRADEVIR
jgi:ABC-type uncharacterized transport system substrate-binding protein